MKKFTKIFFAVAALAVGFSCTTDTTEDLSLSIKGKGTKLAISLEESRTQLGEKAGDVYPLYWSEGDKIAVNGVASAALTAEEAGAAGALFTFESELVRPYNIVYPAPAEGVGEGTVYPVTFAATQPYTEGTFASGVAPMYGYAAELAEGEAESAIQLNHLTGVLRFAIKGEATLSSIAITAEKPIAGAFTVDCANGTLTAGAEASNTVTVTFGEGLALTEEATPIYVAVPAGEHGLFNIVITSTEGEKMTAKFDSSSKHIAVGVVHEFKDILFMDNSPIAGDFIIDSEDALFAFAAKATNFAPYTKAVVTADITLTKAWTPIEDFGSFEFDGGDKTISGLTAPLFNATSANIHNLTLANVALNTTAFPKSGAFACKIDAGSLTYCSATGTSVIDCAEFVAENYCGRYETYAHGGLVGYINNSTIDHCTSDIDITIAAIYQTGKYKSSVGGIVGTYANECTLTNLTNKGDITYTGTTQAGTLYLSGIAGRDNEDSTAGPQDVIAMDNLTNEGAITAAEGSKSTAAIMLSGIIGFIQADSQDVTATNLVNKGNILLASECTATYSGGLIGRTCHAHLTDCQNTGNITISENATIPLAYVGGIIGAGVLKGRELTNCDNSGNICSKPTIAVAEGGAGVYLGGIVAYCGNNCTFTNCDNTGSVEQIGKATGPTNASVTILAGICGEAKKALVMSNCTNGGKISYQYAEEDANAGIIHIAGIIGRNASEEVVTTISGCTNNGTVEFKGKMNGAQEVGVGGIIGYVYASTTTKTVTIENCTNGKTGLIHCNGGAASKNLGVGGIIGMTQRGNIVVDGCKNYGTIKQSGDLLKPYSTKNRYTSGNGFGGVIGINRQIYSFTNCENYGQIEIANTNCDDVCVYAGGVIGWAVAEDKNSGSTYGAFTIKGCSNYANLTFTGQGKLYYAGGVIGCVMANENASKRYWKEISGLKSVANLTFNATAVEGSGYAFGGAVGVVEVVVLATTKHNNIAIDNSVVYGDLRADGMSGKAGVIMGVARDEATVIATNCKIGGKIATTTTKYEDADGVEVIAPLWVELSDTNYFDYMYGGTTDWTGVENYDGCSFLSVVPEV